MIPLIEVCGAFRGKSLTIGFTNGCFDLLHAGHLHLLRESNKHCGILIVGLNADKSVTRLKPSRPINKWKKRRDDLIESGLVDFVLEFDTEEDLESMLRKIEPDVMFKGSDYLGKDITGAEYAKKIRLISVIQGISTTKILSNLPSN